MFCWGCSMAHWLVTLLQGWEFDLPPPPIHIPPMSFRFALATPGLFTFACQSESSFSHETMTIRMLCCTLTGFPPATLKGTLKKLNNNLTTKTKLNVLYVKWKCAYMCLYEVNCFVLVTYIVNIHFKSCLVPCILYNRHSNCGVWRNFKGDTGEGTKHRGLCMRFEVGADLFRKCSLKIFFK